MRRPFWLNRPRASAAPLVDVSAAALGNTVCATVLLAVAALAAGGSRAAGAVAFGGGAVVLSLAVSLGLGLLLARSAGSGGRPADPAPALLVGYAMKVLVGAGALMLVPFPQAWPGAWALTAAVLGVLVMLGTEVWSIRRLRIPYFVSD